MRPQQVHGPGYAFELHRTDVAEREPFGYPEQQDLYLVESVEVDPDTGSFLLDGDGTPVSRGSSILIRWDEVEYLDLIEFVRAT